MKDFIKNYVHGGHLIECCVLFPCINLNWMHLTSGKSYEVNISWLFWYLSIGNIRYTLKKNGY